MEDKILKSRRQVLTAVGVGVASALAGCSGNGSDGESDSPPEEESPTDSATESPTDRETSSPTEEGTSTTAGSNDTIHDGEERLEEYISESLPDAKFPEGQQDYLWLEFENADEQLDTSLEWGPSNSEAPADGDLGNILYWAERGKNPQAEFDTMYLLFDGSESVSSVFLSEKDYDPEVDVEENMVNSPGGYQRMGGGTLEEWTFEEIISEAVEDYSDVSDDFPQEYLNLVNQ